MNAVFTPLALALGLASGQVSKKIFNKIWSLIDDEEAPHPKHREIAYAKLLAALVIQGAIVGLVRGLVEHGSHHGWRKLTGAWPGAEGPEPE